MKIQKYLRESPLFAVNSAYESMVTKVNAELKTDGVNLLQGLVLTALFFENSQSLSPSQLSETFQTSRGNMSHCLSHLEYKGWVKRQINMHDARGFHIALKAEGRKKALELIKYFDAIQNKFEKDLSVATLKKTCENLNLLKASYQQTKTSNKTASVN